MMLFDAICADCLWIFCGKQNSSLFVAEFGKNSIFAE